MSQFKRTPNPTFKTDVAISLPGDQPEWKIETEYRYKKKSDAVAWLAGLKGKTDAENLASIIVGWNEEHAGVAYSTESLAEFLDEFPAAAVDFFETYKRELLEAKRKN